MITIILTIIIVYALWFLVRPWIARYARRKMEERVQEMFRRQFGDAFGSPFGAPSGTPSGSEPPHPRHTGKKIGPDIGEYIEFEESDTPLPPPAHTTPQRPEPQISDAEWEEL